MTGHVPPGSALALVVVSYGSHAMLAENLPAGTVAALEAEVVVVDNFSTQAERVAVTDLAADRGWVLETPTQNLGFGSGMNLGVRRALSGGADVVVLLNPDLRAPAETIAALARAVRADPHLVASPRVLHPDGSVWFAGGEVRVEEGRTVTVGADAGSPHGWLSGACLAIGAEQWRATGGFDEDYFLYWEDVDLSWRARAAGGHLAVLQDLDVVHDVGGTQGSGKSTTYLHYNARNRLVFAAQHLGPRDRRRWVAASIGYARLLLRRAGYGRRDLVRAGRAVLAVLSGTLSGIGYLVRHRPRRPSA